MAVLKKFSFFFLYFFLFFCFMAIVWQLFDNCFDNCFARSVVHLFLMCFVLSCQGITKYAKKIIFAASLSICNLQFATLSFLPSIFSYLYVNMFTYNLIFLLAIRIVPIKLIRLNARRSKTRVIIRRCNMSKWCNGK